MQPKQLPLRVAVLVAALSLPMVACKGDAGGAPGEGGGPGGPGGGEMPPPEVGVVTLAPRAVTLTTELPGRTSASLVAEIRPQVGGLLVERAFTEGADVQPGDLLYKIDPAPYELAVQSAEASVQRAQVALNTARGRSRRFDALASGDVVAKQDRDDASGAAAEAQAALMAGKAALAQAKVDLERTQIKAPIAGRIGRSMVTQGGLVAPYQPNALATIQQLDPIYVDISQSTVDMLRLRRALASGALAKKDAATVELVLEDGTRYAHKGTLQFVDAAVDPGTGSITLRATFPNPDKELLPGMFVRAIVEEGVAETALLVPQQGVTRDPKGQPTALVLDPKGMVEPRVLKVDRTIGDQWLVVDGLKAGEQVIVEGLQKARPGAPAKGSPASFLAPPSGDGKPGDGKAAPGDGKPPEGGDATPEAPKAEAPQAAPPKSKEP